MPGEEKKQIKNKKDDYDVDKARKIVLELIGENEKVKKDFKKIDEGILITKGQVNIPDLPSKPSIKKENISDNIEPNIDLQNKIAPIKRRVIKNTEKELLSKKKSVDKNSAKLEIKKDIAIKKKIFKPKNLIFIFLITAILFIAFYCAFTILIINFNIDNKITRKIADYLPVPAYISSEKIIEYYEFKDFVEKYKSEKREDVKLKIISTVFGDNPEKNIWSLVD